jgi:hypothetical protein
MSIRPHAAGTLVSLAAAALLSTIAIAVSTTPAQPSVGSDVDAGAPGKGPAPPDEISGRGRTAGAA